MKEDNLKRLHTIKVQLYDILEKAKLGKSKKIGDFQGSGEEWVGEE